MARAKAQITVKLAKLTEAIRAVKVPAGTALKKFLEDLSINYDSKVRVNAETKTAGYKLKKGDIVTIVPRVSGGK